MKILFICLGNICRSPIAHGLMVQKMKARDLDWEIDSAGIGGWHEGELPDRRSIAEMRKHDIDITYQRARQIRKSDFDYYDHLVVMDRENYNDIMRLTSDDSSQKNKISMIMNWQIPAKNIIVPDPYYDGRFRLVYDLLDGAIDAMIEQLTGDQVQMH